MGNGFWATRIALHWLVLVLYNLLRADDMSHLWRQIEHGTAVPTTTAAWVHIIVGCLVLAFALWRLVLRYTRTVPPAPKGEGWSVAMAGWASHAALHVLRIVLPVTGLLV